MAFELKCIAGLFDIIEIDIISLFTDNASTSVTRQPMFGFFFKIGGIIPWVNITRLFFRFCKIFNFEFKKKMSI